MKVKIKKLCPEAIIPTYAHNTDAGLDLVAISKDIIDTKDYGYYQYKTGLSLEIPEGFVGLIYPRSSISKTGMILCNSVGVIDSGYRGEIELRFRYIKNTTEYNIGDKIGQLVIIPYPKIEFEEVEEHSKTTRGEGGFGSTDAK